MRKDSLGDRMKGYEHYLPNKFVPGLPIVVRLDGRAFHSWTVGLDRPYHEDLSMLMRDTMLMLVKESNARLGYTQSDEISLILYTDDLVSDVYFGGKVQKIVSMLAVEASLFFNEIKHDYGFPQKHLNRPARFDARAFQVPSKEEACNYILWRERDAIKNSVSMAAQSVCSHRELHGLNGSQRLAILSEKGIDWNNYPDFFKRGTYGQRVKVVRKFTVDELDRLPEKHEALFNPDLEIVRSDVQALENVPEFNEILDKPSFVFYGKTPVTASSVGEEGT